MVGEVEEFRAEVEEARLAEAELLADAEIQIGVTGRADNSDSGVAELAAFRLLECVEVDPVVNRLIGRFGIADQQRTPLSGCAAADGLFGDVVRENRDREARVRA